MKVYFDNDLKTLIIEAENIPEGVALNSWFDKYIEPLKRGTVDITIKPYPHNGHRVRGGEEK